MEVIADLPRAGRVVMPSDWTPVCGAGFQGRVRFRRRFHWPTPLTPRERVWLVFDDIIGTAVVHLNDRQLGECSTADGPAEFDITSQLQPTNILLVDVSFLEQVAEHEPTAPTVGGITGEVRLEVRLGDRQPS